MMTSSGSETKILPSMAHFAETRRPRRKESSPAAAAAEAKRLEGSSILRACCKEKSNAVKRATHDAYLLATRGTLRHCLVCTTQTTTARGGAKPFDGVENKSPHHPLGEPSSSPTNYFLSAILKRFWSFHPKRTISLLFFITSPSHFLIKEEHVFDMKFNR
ncbi:hypothetical protein PIB30_076912, partial [Stylosanthes scabra]|nr:hypothetical protein [Stylosanthes scabra]